MMTLLIDRLFRKDYGSSLGAPLFTLCVASLLFMVCSVSLLKPVEAQRRRAAVEDHDLSGLWLGDYLCDRQHHMLMLELTEGRRGKVKAIFHGLYQDQEYLSFEMRGRVKERARGLRLMLEPGSWIEKPAHDFVSVALSGKVIKDKIRGRLDDQACGEFEVKRLSCDFSESAPCSRAERDLFAQHINRFGKMKDRQNRGSRRAQRARRRARRARQERQERQERAQARQSEVPEAPEVPEVPEAPKYRPVTAIDQAAFAPLINHIEEASFDPKRIALLSLAMQHSYLTSAQAKRILESFTFDPKRLEAVKLMVGRIVDPKSHFSLLESFTFDPQRNRAAELLAHSTVPAPVLIEPQAHKPDRRSVRKESKGETRSAPQRVAMEAELFARLLANVSEKSFDKGRQSLVALSAGSSWFSAEQVKRLIEEWTFEPAKITALKTLAPRILDLDQSFLILDSFTFDQYRAQATKILKSAKPASAR